MRKLVACLIALAAMGTASANPIIFTGSDPGVGPGGARPNSDAARNAFAAAIAGNTGGTITFDSTALGFYTPINAGSGVSISLGGLDPAFSGILAGGDTVLGYDVTAGGTGRFLRVGPNFGVDGTATFNFTDPISAFGAYFTGVGTAGGGVRIQFNDGTAQDFGLTGSGNGGVLFFGFTDFGKSISSVTVRSLPAGSRDIIGIDGVQFANAAVPEPISMVVFGSLVVGGIVAVRRRMTKAAA